MAAAALLKGSMRRRRRSNSNSICAPPPAAVTAVLINICVDDDEKSLPYFSFGWLVGLLLGGKIKEYTARNGNGDGNSKSVKEGKRE